MLFPSHTLENLHYNEFVYFKHITEKVTFLINLLELKNIKSVYVIFNLILNVILRSTQYITRKNNLLLHITKS